MKGEIILTWIFWDRTWRDKHHTRYQYQVWSKSLSASLKSQAFIKHLNLVSKSHTIINFVCSKEASVALGALLPHKSRSDDNFRLIGNRSYILFFNQDKEDSCQYLKMPTIRFEVFHEPSACTTPLHFTNPFILMALEGECLPSLLTCNSQDIIVSGTHCIWG